MLLYRFNKFLAVLNCKFLFMFLLIQFILLCASKSNYVPSFSMFTSVLVKYLIKFRMSTLCHPNTILKYSGSMIFQLPDFDCLFMYKYSFCFHVHLHVKCSLFYLLCCVLCMCKNLQTFISRYNALIYM